MRALATNRAVVVQGVRFDFNPPTWPAADGHWDWAPEPLFDWCARAGLGFPVPSSPGQANAPRIYQGCEVYAHDAQATREGGLGVLDEAMFADLVEVRLRLREPTGEEHDLDQPFRFFRDPASFVSLATAAERIARATSAAGSDLSGLTKRWWEEAGRRQHELVEARDRLLGRIQALEHHADQSPAAPRKTYSPDQIAFLDLVEKAMAFGYAVRSAEFAAYEVQAEAGQASKNGGAEGGRRSGKTRAGKTMRWQAEALPLVERAVAKPHIRSISKAAEDVLASWRGPEDDTPSVAWVRGFIKELVDDRMVTLTT
jgi:hypothetical protein